MDGLPPTVCRFLNNFAISPRTNGHYLDKNDPNAYRNLGEMNRFAEPTTTKYSSGKNAQQRSIGVITEVCSTFAMLKYLLEGGRRVNPRLRQVMFRKISSALCFSDAKNENGTSNGDKVVVRNKW